LETEGFQLAKIKMMGLRARVGTEVMEQARQVEMTKEIRQGQECFGLGKGNGL